MNNIHSVDIYCTLVKTFLFAYCVFLYTYIVFFSLFVAGVCYSQKKIKEEHLVPDQSSLYR